MNDKLDLPKLQSIIMGGWSFESHYATIMSNLLVMKSIDNDGNDY